MRVVGRIRSRWRLGAGAACLEICHVITLYRLELNFIIRWRILKPQCLLRHFDICKIHKLKFRRWRRLFPAVSPPAAAFCKAPPNMLLRQLLNILAEGNNESRHEYQYFRPLLKWDLMSRLFEKISLACTGYCMTR